MKDLAVNKISKIRIYISSGVGCQVSDSENLFIAANEYLKNNNLQAEIIKVGTAGNCSDEPMMAIESNGRTRVYFANVQSDEVGNLLGGFFCGEPQIERAKFQKRNLDSNKTEWNGLPFIHHDNFFAWQTKLLTKNWGVCNPFDIDEYYESGGFSALRKALCGFTPLEVCDLVIDSFIRERSIVERPFGKKLLSVFNVHDKQKYLICNAEDSCPDSFLNKTILENSPYQIIEGIIIAAYAIGAEQAFIYVPQKYADSVMRMDKAIGLATDRKLLNVDLFGCGFKIDINIIVGEDAAYCPEDSAVVAAIEGKSSLMRSKPFSLSDKGLFGKPTLVTDVETLVNMTEIVSKGSDWFKSIGTEFAKGTKIIELIGTAREGYIEVAMGASLRRIIYGIGGGAKSGKSVKAALFDGTFGGIIPEENFDIKLCYEEFSNFGLKLGFGRIEVLDTDDCIVEKALVNSEFFKRKSCGACIPCREGSRRISETLEMLSNTNNDRKSEARLKLLHSVFHLKELAEVIKETSLCGFGKSAPNNVLSAMKWFSDDFDAHIYESKCPVK